MDVDLATIELIVFDWDGTLMDSEARIVACMQGAFTDCALRAPSSDAVRDIIGLGLREAIERLRGADGPEHTHAILNRYRARYLSEDETPAALFDGAAVLIERLHQDGRLLAVATGKSRRGLNQALAETGLGALFHGTRCADETFSKPHPGMLLELMDELGVDPACTLMIGDTEYDMQMARNAGTHSLAVGYGTQPAERLLALGPMGCAASVAELAHWLLQDREPLASQS